MSTRQADVERAESLVRQRFSGGGVTIVEFSTKVYPEEIFFIVEVLPDQLSEAVEIGNSLDEQLRSLETPALVTVRRASRDGPSRPLERLLGGVLDPRAEALVSLISVRSRTSERQPSLAYVQNAAANLAASQAARHVLLFGRRGAGKTALLVETRRRIGEQGNLAAWMNLQTYRRETAPRLLLWTLRTVLDTLTDATNILSAETNAIESMSRMSISVEDLLAAASVKGQEVDRLLPQVQRLIRQVTEAIGKHLFVFLDDFHYVARQNQPGFLDALHACVRDADAWLKVATIRHLSKWYEQSSQMGLQTGHDVQVIDLDLSLQDPIAAKNFLETVLAKYANQTSIRGVWELFNPNALDRLVLASGAVPRDYLVLAAGSIQAARNRQKAKQVGGQDVNTAAGDAAQRKLNELQDDLASTEGGTNEAMRALERLRAFCLDDKRWTYFRISFRDKEKHVEEYEVLQSLVDLRLVHLVNPSVSHETKAGERFEVFLLDVSQYTGQRLRKRLHVLDLSQGRLLMKQTGARGGEILATTSHKTFAILRRCPEFPLELLTASASTSS